MDSIIAAYEKFCVERYPLPTDEEVSNLEQRLGVAFPPD
jgi:hypothetical protein